MLNGGNVVLIGPMGTGKSTVGKALAEKLGWTFVDTDAVIEEKAGTTIGAIFAEQGEPAFRKMESETIASVLQGETRIVSTGGGAVLAEQNRKAMKTSGFVIALRATEETIIMRVGNDENRPLLQGNAAERVRRILEERKHAYDFADFTIDTTDKPVEVIVDLIVSRLPRGEA
ncbi:Shikimate kinase 2 [Paenibacillus allorhizosphaerae]|uniref:Shikimate kinase n=1 Tax=Paenibacillus allorhizosphaerae TaxID=2849866 RepID=A0ABM8VBY7_9BACL|nr:Shikimate kinase 2 [Paenibacillus allorhizosphaerae]